MGFYPKSGRGAGCFSVDIVSFSRLSAIEGQSAGLGCAVNNIV